MKKLILLPLMMFATTTFANELQNFDQVKSAVTSGKTIRILVDFAKCNVAKKSEPQFNLGIYTPNEIIVDKTGRVLTSFLHFTLNIIPNHPTYQFVRYALSEDNMVNVSVQVLNATNYQPISDKFSADCKIGSGAKIYY